MVNKKLSNHRGTEGCTMSVEISSTAAQLYKKNHIWQSLQKANDLLHSHSRLSEMPLFDRSYITSD